MMKEAVASVSIEHASDCDCTVCRAADGDRDAMAEIYADGIRCREITDKGTRCVRHVSRDEDYCWQHKKE